MKLIIGLGNPGKEYVSTRHNVGQMAIAKLINKLGLDLQSSPKLDAQLVSVGQGSDKVFFGITTHYMNNSGIAVQKILDYYKIDPADLYVIHDDLDLGVGESKQQFDRGSAGHNGIKSIIEHINSQAFNRIRIGIGHPRISSNPNLPVEDYVLLPFTTQEKVIIDQTIDKIVKDFDNLIS